MVVLDVDLSSSTRKYKFAKKIPGRFFNFDIAEQNMVVQQWDLRFQVKFL